MRGRYTLGTLGVGVFAVLCCVGLPSVLVALGGVTAAGVLGGGLAAAALLACAAVIAVRARRRRDCARPARKADE
jgi:hypothetical protein